MTSELQRLVALDRIGPHGTAVSVEATPDELEAIAARLRILAAGRLHCTFRLRRIGSALIEAQGSLSAQVSEVCVVSLDSFSHDVRETFTVHFVPAGAEDDEPDPDAVDQIPFTAGAIDIGEAAVEQLALVLDPYPRKPGAALPDSLQDGIAGPFGALAGLRLRK